mgnify:CR=1 FL=1
MDSLTASRITISIVIFLYSCYHAWLGVASLYAYSSASLAVTMIGLYLIISLASIVFYKGFRIPIWLAILNLVFTAVTPLVFSQIIIVNEPASYATWYVVGLGTLMGITSFRGHVVIGWLGFALIAGQVVAWGGIGVLLNAGILGALLMVFAGHAAGYAIRTADAQASEAMESQRNSSVVAIGRTAARNARQERIQQTLQKAEPLLTAIVENDGQLSAEHKTQAQILEAGLRDLIRGRGLIDDRVSEAANRARQRGVKVELLDEGGLEDVEQTERLEILRRVTEAIDSVSHGKITIRSPKGESWKVTIAAMSPERSEPSVWERI